MVEEDEVEEDGSLRFFGGTFGILCGTRFNVGIGWECALYAWEKAVTQQRFSLTVASKLR